MNRIHVAFWLAVDTVVIIGLLLALAVLGLVKAVLWLAKP